jgi:hypothetical protein
MPERDPEDMEFTELMEYMQEHEGRDILQAVEGLSTTQYILQRNFQDLKNAIEYYEDNDDLIYQKNREKLDGFLKEFLRLLHNYLASVNALKNHSYAIGDRYDQELKESYSSELSNRGLDKIGSFLKELRDFTQHKDLPPVSAMTEFSQEDGLDRSLTVDKEELLERDDWNQLSRDYMEGYDEMIDLSETIEEYHDGIMELFEWFKQRIIDHFPEEVEEYGNIEEEFFERTDNREN